MRLSRRWLTSGQRSPPVKDKLDSVMERLERLCSEESDNVLQDDSKHERWVKLFEYVQLVQTLDRANSLPAL